MNETIAFLFPFFKNLSILYLTVFLLFFFKDFQKSGLDGFVLKAWLIGNHQRFIAGGVFIFALSCLMALTDVAPLFTVFGFNINASPVGLGVAIGALLLFGFRSKTPESDNVVKAQAIIEKSNEITQQAAEIVEKEAAKEKQ